ncbi:hypothetical protein EMEDMD4_570133 [Sinorhizobium medicae]|uniref:Uncharacterized protein n=1 Tax=Sinorhizobium medicae TaxID=110321 RepID=A0A508X8R0_9HYPH|nr:hypothetical protein EMEDMD4_570133 [Sinorhizobium medicae]
MMDVRQAKFLWMRNHAVRIRYFRPLVVLPLWVRPAGRSQLFAGRLPAPAPKPALGVGFRCVW